MKATVIVRRIENLGRVVILKEPEELHTKRKNHPESFYFGVIFIYSVLLMGLIMLYNIAKPIKKEATL